MTYSPRATNPPEHDAECASRWPDPECRYCRGAGWYTEAYSPLAGDPTGAKSYAKVPCDCRGRCDCNDGPDCDPRL